MSKQTMKRRRGRPVLSDEEKKWKRAADACGITVATAKRYVRRGNGCPATSLLLGKLLGLSGKVLIYGTRDARSQEATAPASRDVRAGQEPQLCPARRDGGENADLMRGEIECR